MQRRKSLCLSLGNGFVKSGKSLAGQEQSSIALHDVGSDSVDTRSDVLDLSTFNLSEPMQISDPDTVDAICDVVCCDDRDEEAPELLGMSSSFVKRHARIALAFTTT